MFNPWGDYTEQLDMGPDAPDIRTNHFMRFLEPRLHNARYIFVAEALGFHGGRFSGIPMTSERIITGKHLKIDYQNVFSGRMGTRTSNPNSQYPGFKKTWRREGLSEQTATIVWKTILENNIDPFEIILWNIFPFHPYRKEEGLHKNRTPNPKELESGVYFLKKLLKLCPKDIKIISIGRESNLTLIQHGFTHIHITHPANGGAPKFKEGCKKIFLRENVLKNNPSLI